MMTVYENFNFSEMTDNSKVIFYAKKFAGQSC